MTKTSAQFYKELGATRLAARKTDTHTKKELRQLIKLLGKEGKILDLACGYGRFTIPLAKKGYTIEGIDISPNLIAKAKADAKKEKQKIIFKLGDMRKLPYEDARFDYVICMWSAFNELPTVKDQLRALTEIVRVLSDRGTAFLEMPEPKKTEKRTDTHIIDGVKTTRMYYHDKTTITRLLEKIDIRYGSISVADFGGRKRLLVLIQK